MKLPQILFERLSLEDENRILRQILINSSDPILITTDDVKIIYVNSAWEKLTGYTFEEVAGESPSILQSRKTPSRVYKKMWHALSHNKSFTSNDIIDKRKKRH
jgi:PAS domain S-box-containing protein